MNLIDRANGSVDLNIPITQRRIDAPRANCSPRAALKNQ
jgi:hypothetical protein